MTITSILFILIDEGEGEREKEGERAMESFDSIYNFSDKQKQKWCHS